MKPLGLLASTGRRYAMMSAHIIGFTTAVLLTCAVPSSGTEAAAKPAPPSLSDTVPLYTNLGSHHKRISTRVPATQEDFDRHYLTSLSFFGIEKAAAPPGDKHPHGMRISVEVTKAIKKLRDESDWGREQLEVSFRPLRKREGEYETHEPIRVGRVSLAIDS